MFGAALKSLRKEMYDLSESLGSLLDKGQDQTALVQGLLQYATTGNIKYGSISMSNPIVFLLHDLLPEIDEAVCRESSLQRARTVNRILVHLWTYFEEDIDENEPESPEEGEDQESDAEVKIPDFLQGIIGSTMQGTGTKHVRDTVENRRKLKELLSNLHKNKSASPNGSKSAVSTAELADEDDGDEDEDADSLDNPEAQKGELTAGAVGKARKCRLIKLVRITGNFFKSLMSQKESPYML